MLRPAKSLGGPGSNIKSNDLSSAACIPLTVVGEGAPNPPAKLLGGSAVFYQYTFKMVIYEPYIMVRILKFVY